MQRDSASFHQSYQTHHINIINIRVLRFVHAITFYKTGSDFPIQDVIYTLRINDRDQTSRLISAQYANSAIALRGAETVKVRSNVDHAVFRD